MTIELPGGDTLAAAHEAAARIEARAESTLADVAAVDRAHRAGAGTAVAAAQARLIAAAAPTAIASAPYPW